MEILKCTYTPLIEHIGQTISALFSEYIKKALVLSDGVGTSIKNHYWILEVLALKDTEKVMKIVEKTLTEWSNQLQV